VVGGVVVVELGADVVVVGCSVEVDDVCRGLVWPTEDPQPSAPTPAMETRTAAASLLTERPAGDASPP
jgi:hypothetical protein